MLGAALARRATTGCRQLSLLSSAADGPAGAYLDASWHMPGSGRDARAEFTACRIPGATFFDIDEISDTTNPLPHMLPNAGQMDDALDSAGVVDDETEITVYDNAGMLSSSRAWYTLTALGVANPVRILDGGLALWRALGRPVESGDASVPGRPSVGKRSPCRLRRELVRTLDDMKANLVTREAQVVDARPAARFLGQLKEPRPGLCSGHIPGSLNVPWTTILDSSNGAAVFKPAEGIAKTFEDAGVRLDGDRGIILTCGSGVTASVLMAGLVVAGVELERLSLYDGSWSEWVTAVSTGKVTGDVLTSRLGDRVTRR